MSKWLNNEKPIYSTKKEKYVYDGKTYVIHVIKPCHNMGYCPYGQLVEEYPLSKSDRSCKVFGHDCPVFYLAEFITEDD